MKLLYFDLGMGAAGDMLAASLYDLLPDREQYLRDLNAAGIPGVEIRAEKIKKSGILGTQFRVFIDHAEEETEDVPGGHEHHHEHGHEGHEHHHEHDFEAHGHHHEHDFEAHEHHHEHGHEGHEHHHSHAHHSMADITRIIRELALPEPVREKIKDVYTEIAGAESRIHGESVSEIHFHEVGSMDAVADIAAVCYAIYLLAPDRVIASPVATGFGHVRCAHGILPVPAPATALLLKGIPSYAGSEEGELCTPTGAALIRTFADAFGTMPVMSADAVGYGMGKKEFSKLNCVRACLGTADAQEKKAAPAGGPSADLHAGASVNAAGSADSADGLTDTVTELACNLDDMTGEEIGFACEELLRGGALDVWTSPIQMKKGRPGILLSVLCRDERKEDMIRLIFRHTTTLGVRETLHRRYILNRSACETDTEFGKIRKKVSRGYGVTREKAEYDDLAAAARR